MLDVAAGTGEAAMAAISLVGDAGVFPDPARGLAEFRRVLRDGGRAAACVISIPERAPMWGVLAETLSRHLPAQREALHLSFSLAHRRRLESMLAAASFREVSVTQETHEGIFQSFDEYWAGIEAGTGQQPLIYLGLPEQERRVVRDEVHAGLLPFESNGRLETSVEMLIGAGRA